MMSVHRALVDCAVLSLRDNTVIYPACSDCCSRIEVERNGGRCSRCGFRCPREQMEYRYRLSLTVSRSRRIFGVTVFGSCLNPFFGIPASGLQRLVGPVDGPVDGPVVGPSKAKLLLRAVKECFIGRHFIFSIKLPGPEGGFSFEDPDRSAERVQFVATQMVLPSAAGLKGCTVVSFYQLLLHRAAEHQGMSTDATTDVPVLGSPHSSSSNSTLHSSVASLSLPRLHRSLHLPLTPQWQQSLGLVTSSAEQEEGLSSSDDEEDEVHIGQQLPVTTAALPPQNSLQRKTTPENHLQKLFFSPQGPAAVSPSQPGHRIRSLSTVFPTRQTCETGLSKMLPSSEHLTEFLDDKIIISKMNRSKKVRTDGSEGSEEQKLPTRPSCAHLSKVHCGLTLDAVDQKGAWSPEDRDENSYDCSADMFYSPLKENNPRTLRTSVEIETGQIVAEFSPTPCVFKRRITESCSSHLDFCPQIQSTPVLKVNCRFGSPASAPLSSKRSRTEDCSRGRGDRSTLNVQVLDSHTPVSNHCLVPGSVVRTQSGRVHRCRRTLLTCRSTLAEGSCLTRATITNQVEPRCDWSRDLFSDSD